VDAAADKKSIRAAYRKKAKSVHPDMPTGDPKRFALVKRAHDILTDDERRAKYDATGDESEQAPDNEFSAAVNVIGMALNAVLADCAQNGESPLERDLCMAIKQNINKNIQECHKQLRIHKTMLDIDKKMAGRFKGKKKDQRNILEDIVAHRVQSLQRNIQNLESNVKNCESALEMIKDFSFKSDPKERDINSIGTLRFMTTGNW
jgi:curved DNA-binding protein CbpA